MDKKEIEPIRLRQLLEKDVNGMLEWMHDPDIQNNFRVALQEMGEEEALRFIKEAE